MSLLQPQEPCSHLQLSPDPPRGHPLPQTGGTVQPDTFVGENFCKLTKIYISQRKNFPGLPINVSWALLHVHVLSTQKSQTKLSQKAAIYTMKFEKVFTHKVSGIHACI